MTQDFGVRAALELRAGQRPRGVQPQPVQQPGRDADRGQPVPAVRRGVRARRATPATGGASRAPFINAPDNAANTGAAGFLLKFARQTRIGGDVAIAQWTQNAQFYPYTINSTVLTPAGAGRQPVGAAAARSTARSTPRR